MGVLLPLPVPAENVFPDGCFITSEVEPIAEYVDGKPGPQSIDEATNLPMWSFSVHDADKTVKGQKKSLKIKMIAAEAPELPPSRFDDMLFCPAVLEGVMIRPYATEVMTGRFAVAYSITCRGFREPTKDDKAAKADSKDAKASKPN